MRILARLDQVLRQAVRIRGGRSRIDRVRSHTLHWYELAGAGGGPPAVLVHGLGANANTFFQILQPLRRRYSRIYVPDLPGHGFSLLPASGPIDIRGHYEALCDFIGEVVGEPAVVVGNSMGGAISLQFAIDRPDETAGLALLSPAGAPLDEEGRAYLNSHFQIRTGADGVKFLRTMMHRPPAGHSLVGRDVVEFFGSPVVSHVLRRAEESPEQLDTAAIRRLPMPVALIWGASERLLPPRGIDFFRDHLPAHARIEIFERCGHVPMLEQPRRTVMVLNDLAAESHRYMSPGVAGT